MTTMNCLPGMLDAIQFGDCRDSLRAMAAAGVKAQTCVTSPPYFGLRDYGHEGQLGLEETPEQYIANMVGVFRAVRDVLADDGTLWLNIGDSYARNPAKGQHKPGDSGKQAYIYDRGNGRASATFIGNGVKEKDLIGIPWMLAFALRAGFAACTCCGVERRSDLWPTHNGHRICIDCLIAGSHEAKIVQTEPGWYLRQDIIWHKPNPMPESVTDRCTKAHEYVFLLSKAPRYYFDSEAIKEDAVCAPSVRQHQVQERDRKVLRTDIESRHRSAIAGGQTLQANPDGKRNRRSVWTIATKPYKGAHFAVFPPDLIEPCILAGSRPGDTVLDPFMGSATTAAVAIEHGRHFTGCELNLDYKPLQDQRIAEARAACAAKQEAAELVARQNVLFPEMAAELKAL